MRLNKKTKGGFVGPLCGVMALGIIGLGISCPYMNGAHAADEYYPIVSEYFDSECTVEGSHGYIIRIDEAGNVITHGVKIGSVTKNIAPADKPVENQTGNVPILNANGMNYADSKYVDEKVASQLNDNLQYEFPELFCKKADVEFRVNVKPTADQMETWASETPNFKFEVVATKSNPFYDSQGRDAESNVKFQVYAENNDRDYPGAKEESDVFQFLANIKDFVQITRPETSEGLDNVRIEVNPGNFASSYTDFDVIANRGYEIHVTADDVDLTSATDGNESKITPITSNIAATNAVTNFGDNTWGYSVDAKTSETVNVTTYRPITSTAGEAALRVTSGGEATYRFTCGTKIGSSLPADEYSTTVKISAVIPPAAAANL